MILLTSMKKIFSKVNKRDAETVPFKTERQKEIEFQARKAVESISELDKLHRRVMNFKSNPSRAELAIYIIGKHWDKMLTLSDAVRYCHRWLEDNNLDIGQEANNLLLENRRNPLSESAVKSGTVKGNLHIYGRCPFVQRKRYTYSEVVLHKWLEENVKPYAKLRGEAA
jgi:hypothetical protein